MRKQKIPVEWITIHFKEYPRLDKINLPKNFPRFSGSLETSIRRRKSRRKFSGKPLSLRELSKLLYYSCGITRRSKDLNMTRRAYPSGGARYPSEVYVLILKKNNLKPGLYHYNVKHHALELLLEGDYVNYLKYLYEQNVAKGLAALIIITSIFIRTAIKYPTQWRRFAVLEAGHIGQNIYLISESMGLGCCAIGGWDETAMNKLLDIDGEYESITHMVAVGKNKEFTE